MTMAEFLVEFDIRVPPGTRASEVKSRMAAEAAAAAGLGEQGILVRLWRLGGTRALGVYRADSLVQLTGLLHSLPLHDWMQITVTPLEPHPNDPAANSRSGQAVGAQP